MAVYQTTEPHTPGVTAHPPPTGSGNEVAAASPVVAAAPPATGAVAAGAIATPWKAGHRGHAHHHNAAPVHRAIGRGHPAR
jgi:hypothetical protein